MAVRPALPRRLQGLRGCTYVLVSLLMDVSFGLIIPRTLPIRGDVCPEQKQLCYTNKGSRLCHIRLHQKKVEEDEVNGKERIINEHNIQKTTTTSKPLTCRKRCPDFPSFAFDAGYYDEKLRPSVRVRLNDKDKTTEETPSWVYKAATELPVEPGFFLEVANSARRTRLLKYRAYASRAPFSAANVTCPPSLADLDTPPRSKWETFWISAPARFVVFASSFLAFPLIIRALDAWVTLEPEKLNEISSTFGPGISILYGTFVSLTLSILYNRQQYIQDDIAQETALLIVIVRNFMTIFQGDRELAVEAGQAVADQIRMLVRGSRAAELTLLMYSDPYSRMLELISLRECQVMTERDGELGGHGLILGSCRDLVKDLVKVRAKRLSDEAVSLPPTHFFVLTTLTSLILLGYCVSTLPTVGPDGAPSFESSVLFAILSTVYVFFYSFANDLNNPFQGVYQIRRSTGASQLLEIKWFLANHPLVRGEVDFEEVEESSDGEVCIRSPGLGDMLFEKEDIYPDSRPESL